ncbi:hypothetical protein P154DRAFT_614487 [Amniculicola lignicola CBS 123094]|uniref:RING-type domain-containing protein n=1 Tax=Amniculicola lignicola CBS 123094 TaxID=1392246 RepID=A0A6A5X5J1_9PLEO|nr:hypothetical protein P154DRAFT_614487 [Amniculicola lignicola CBS 123094]
MPSVMFPEFEARFGYNGGCNGMYFHIAEPFLPFLDLPKELHVLFEIMMKALDDSHARAYLAGTQVEQPELVDGYFFRTNSSGIIEGPNTDSVTFKCLDNAWKDWWSMTFLKDEQLWGDLKNHLGKADKDDLWYQLAYYSLACPSPRSTIEIQCPLSGEKIKVVAGKWWIVQHCAQIFFHGGTLRESWPVLSKVIEAPPTMKPHQPLFLNILSRWPLALPQLMDAVACYPKSASVLDEYLGNDLTCHEQAILRTLDFFTYVGSNVVSVWTHFNSPLSHHYRCALAETVRIIKDEIQHPDSPIPRSIRDNLAQVNWEDVFNMMWHAVYVFRHVDHMHLSALNWTLYHNIIGQVYWTTHSTKIRTRFQNLWERWDSDSTNFQISEPLTFTLGGSYLHLDDYDKRLYAYCPIKCCKMIEMPLNEVELTWFDAETEAQIRAAERTEFHLARDIMPELVPIGPRIDIAQHCTLDYNFEEMKDEKCVICLSEFPQRLEHLRGAKNTPVKLNVCPHFFHEECIGAWLNGVSETSNQCPVCREEVCERRDVTVKGEEWWEEDETL